MSDLDLASVRQEYMRERLDESGVDADPIAQFRRWFDEAVKAAVPMGNAMTLATVSAHGQPSARIVLLKGLQERGFTFYTHYDSRKGRELAVNAHAALLVYWIELEREVRIEGVAEKTSPGESDAYFESRPLGSRLAAIASHQSSVIPDRGALERAYADTERRHGGAPQRPADWGGYRIVPHAIEFWQGRENRLHDRLLYTPVPDGWKIERLAP